MVISASKIINLNLFTIRSGAKIGSISGILVDPDRLVVAGYWVQIMNTKEDQILLTGDIREMSIKGVIIDDRSEVVNASDLPKLKSVLDIDYQIPGKKIVCGRKHLGKATDFGIDLRTHQVAQISGKPSIVRSISSSHLSFLRRQIVSVNDDKIEVAQGPLSAKINARTNSLNILPGSHYSANAAETSE